MLGFNDKNILNIEGFIAASLLDAFTAVFRNEEEVYNLVQSEILNGFFVLSRTIGLIGHWNDQKRLKQDLYTVDTEDVIYLGDL